ncbi:MAG: glycosyltransferase family 2 protein [Richelia sp. RM2_1_2]|nr:glycosyltransferase family 2 protein [Richelia sp. RM2_1_2]
MGRIDKKTIIKKRIEIQNGKKILIGKNRPTNNTEKKLNQHRPNKPVPSTPKPVIPTAQPRLVPALPKRAEAIAKAISERDKQRLVNGKKIENMGVGRLEKDKMRQAERIRPQKRVAVDIPVVLKDYGTYVKETEVDFDVVICVTSFERYTKIRRLLRQLFSQKSKYTFKFVLMDDASEDTRYATLQDEFPNMIYLRNKVNGGKENYWRTVNKLWSIGRQYKSHAFLQIDDDFILCNDFLDRLLDEFFIKKEEDNRIMVFSYHIYGYDRDKPQADWWYNGTSIAIDGGTLFDSKFVQLFNYYVDIGHRHIAAHTSTFFWDTIVKYIREFGVRVYRLPNSLAWHDGNFDSKLNFEARRIKKSYTKRFIDGDDKYNKDGDIGDNI